LAVRRITIHLPKLLKEYGVIAYKLQRPEKDVRFTCYLIFMCSMAVSSTVGEIFDLKFLAQFGLLSLLAIPTILYWLYKNDRLDTKIF
jgi:hypothetical protein